jgi:hypothetical protein
MSAAPSPLSELVGLRHEGSAEALAESDDASLLDLVDHLLDKGCVLTGELVLGLANVDLIYVELSLLLCSVDRVEVARSADA